MFRLHDDITQLVLSYMISSIWVVNTNVPSHVSVSENPRATDYLIAHPDQIGHHFSTRTDEKAVVYLLHHPQLIFWKYFSENSNPKAVDYLLRHPHRIDWWYLPKNTHDRAVDYAIQHYRNHPLTLQTPAPHFDMMDMSMIHPEDDRLWRGFSGNPNTKAVVYLLQYPQHIHWQLLSGNTNDLAVQYLLDHPERIVWSWFYRNRNPIVVQYVLDRLILNMLHDIRTVHYAFVTHDDPIMIQYVIDHWDEMDLYDKKIFSSNPHPLAVRYLLTHPESINSHLFCTNSNPDAVTYLFDHPEKINWSVFRNNIGLCKEIADHEFMNGI